MCDDRIERHRRLVHEPPRPPQASLLATVPDEDDGAPGSGRAHHLLGDRQVAGAARGVVVRGVVDAVAVLRGPADRAVQVRGDRDVLVPEHRVAPLHERDDVVRPVQDAGGHRDVQRDRRGQLER